MGNVTFASTTQWMLLELSNVAGHCLRKPAFCNLLESDSDERGRLAKACFMTPKYIGSGPHCSILGLHCALLPGAFMRRCVRV